MALKKPATKERSNGLPSKIQINTSKAGTIEQLKQDAARAPTVIMRLRDKQSVVVRFLEEPTEWTRYFEHSTQRGGNWQRVPCFKGCKLDGKSTARASTRWLANVVDVGTGEVRLLYLTKDMIDTFILKYEKSRGKRNDKEPTLLDRDWTITRIGADQDTKYDIDSEGVGPLEIDGKIVKNPAKRFELLDPADQLTRQIEAYYGADFAAKPKVSKIDDDEDEEEEEDDEEVTAEEEEEEEEEEEDEEDEEDDEDEEEEEEEEEQPRVKRKPLPTAKGKVATGKRR